MSNGGGRITAKQLSEARAEVELAELGQKAESIKREREKEGARLAKITAIQRRLETEGAHSLSQIESLRAALKDTLAAYFEAVANHNSNIYSIRDEIENNGLQPSSASGCVPGFEVSSDANSGAFYIGEIENRIINAPKRDLREMIDQAAAPHFPRGTQ